MEKFDSPDLLLENESSSLGFGEDFLPPRWLKPKNEAILRTLMQRNHILVSSGKEFRPRWPCKVSRDPMAGLLKYPQVPLEYAKELLSSQDDQPPRPGQTIRRPDGVMGFHGGAILSCHVLGNLFKRPDVSQAMLSEIYTYPGFRKEFILNRKDLVSRAAFGSNNMAVIEWAVANGFTPSAEALREISHHINRDVAAALEGWAVEKGALGVRQDLASGIRRVVNRS